jgi:hypothetical protein
MEVQQRMNILHIALIGAIATGVASPSHAAKECREALPILSAAATTVANLETANLSNLKANIQEQMLKSPPAEQRRLQALLPLLLANIYNPGFNTGLVQPETNQRSIDEVIAKCSAGNIVIIPDPDHSRAAIAILCDFDKSIVSSAKSVVCVIRQQD